MKAHIEISGDPVLSIELDDLPSWNKTYKHWTKKSEDTRKFRQYGMSLASKFKANLPKELRKQYAVQRVLIHVRLFPPHDGRMDVFNKNIKAATDGFTDAGLWADDEWATIPLVLFSWGGGFSEKYETATYKTGKRAGTKYRRWIDVTIIDVYELGSFYINDVPQALPEGRVIVEKKVKKVNTSTNQISDFEKEKKKLGAKNGNFDFKLTVQDPVRPIWRTYETNAVSFEEAYGRMMFEVPELFGAKLVKAEMLDFAGKNFQVKILIAPNHLVSHPGTENWAIDWDIWTEIGEQDFAV